MDTHIGAMADPNSSTQALTEHGAHLRFFYTTINTRTSRSASRRSRGLPVDPGQSRNIPATHFLRVYSRPLPHSLSIPTTRQVNYALPRPKVLYTAVRHHLQRRPGTRVQNVAGMFSTLPIGWGAGPSTESSAAEGFTGRAVWKPFFQWHG